MRSEFTISADFLFDGAGRIYEDVSLSINRGRILRIGKRRPSAYDLGSALILPGFVNAHTHLELSHLRRKENGTADFIEWLQRMRRALNGTDGESLTEAAEDGIKESIKSGTTTLVEHTNAGASIEPLLKAPIRAIVALEVVGYSEDELRRKKDWILNNINEVRKSELGRPAIAPHSIYRLSPELIKLCSEIAEREKLLISSHTSESQEEVEFSRNGTGRLRSLIERFGGLPDDLLHTSGTPVENLKRFGLLNRRTLLIHCNYPENGDYRLIKESGATVVYCPRSHSFFKHSHHPFERFLQEGIDVVFGTDSLASTPTLSILDELKFIKGDRKHIPARLLLSLATRTAAERILGYGFGVIKENSPADVCAIKLPYKPKNGKDALEASLNPESKVILTVCNGVVISPQQ